MAVNRQLIDSMRSDKKNTGQYLQRKFVGLLIVDIMTTETYDGLHPVELIEEYKQKDKVMKLMEQVIKNAEKIK